MVWVLGVMLCTLITTPLQKLCPVGIERHCDLFSGSHVLDGDCPTCHLVLAHNEHHVCTMLRCCFQLLFEHCPVVVPYSVPDCT